MPNAPEIFALAEAHARSRIDLQNLRTKLHSKYDGNRDITSRLRLIGDLT